MFCCQRNMESVSLFNTKSGQRDNVAEMVMFDDFFSAGTGPSCYLTTTKSRIIECTILDEICPILS